MRALGLVAVVILAMMGAGCSSQSSYPARADAPPPRTRCLNDRNEGSTRPMFFLFCVESP